MPCKAKHSTGKGEKRVKYKKFAGIFIVFKPTEEHWLPLMLHQPHRRKGAGLSQQCLVLPALADAAGPDP